MKSMVRVRRVGWFVAILSWLLLAFASVAVAQEVTVPGDSLRQPRSVVERQQPQAQRPQPGATNPSDADKPAAADTKNPAAAKLVEAYEKTKTAKTAEEWTSIIELCNDGIRGAGNAETTNYGKKLASWAHNRRGEEYAKQGKESEALVEFVDAIELDGTNWRAYHNRGVSHAMAQRFDAALDDFNRALELHRDYANTWYNRGEIKYSRGDFQGAIQDYSQAIRYAPQDALSYNSRGHALYRTGRVREAMSDYNRAVQLGPDDAGTLTNRGDAYSDQGFFGEAVRDYRQAIKLNPKLGRAYQSVAWLLATCPDERYRDPQAALEAARKAIEIDGEKDYRYLDTLAAAQANAGEFDSAIDTQEKAISAAPPDDATRYRQRLDLYKDKRPFRDGPRAATAPPQRELR